MRRRNEGRVPIVRLAFTRERPSLSPQPIENPRRAGALAEQLLAGRDRETFVVIHLDSKRGLLSAEVVAVGTLNATLVHPREVFKGALLANAASIVVAHNHPSGNPAPSPEDLALTRQLLEAGELLGVPVDDHIIVGDTSASMRETTCLWANAGRGGAP